MKVQISIFLGGKESEHCIAIFESCAVPKVGEKITLETKSFDGTLIVKEIEHHLDLSFVDTFSSHDIFLHCKKVKD